MIFLNYIGQSAKTAWAIAGQFTEEYGGVEPLEQLPKISAVAAATIAPARETDTTLVKKVVPVKGSDFDFPTQDGKFEIHNSVWNKGFIKQFVHRTDIPEKLKACIEFKTKLTSCRGHIKNLDYPVIGSLSDLKMKALLTQYSTKYGIHIELCKSDDIASKLHHLKNNPPPTSPFGLIVIPIKDGGHVTPLLCHFTEDKQQVVIMDAVGIGITRSTFDQSLSACEKGAIDYRFASLPRQADMVSCRTSAAILLRNALLDIKNKQNTHTFTDIITMTRPASDQTIAKEVTIPCEWDYHDQITNLSQPSSEVYVPRQAFSKKSKPPMTVKEFRERHTNIATFEYQLRFYSLSDEFKDLATFTYPPGVEVEFTPSNALYLTWTAQTEINTYLVYKSQRNAMKVLDK